MLSWLCHRNVALASGTERAFSGKTVNGYSHDHKGQGLWVGSVGGLPLFSSGERMDTVGRHAARKLAAAMIKPL